MQNPAWHALHSTALGAVRSKFQEKIPRFYIGEVLIPWGFLEIGPTY
jgi:hypothetical protein